MLIDKVLCIHFHLVEKHPHKVGANITLCRMIRQQRARLQRLEDVKKKAADEDKAFRKSIYQHVSRNNPLLEAKRLAQHDPPPGSPDEPRLQPIHPHQVTGSPPSFTKARIAYNEVYGEYSIQSWKKRLHGQQTGDSDKLNTVAAGIEEETTIDINDGLPNVIKNFTSQLKRNMELLRPVRTPISYVDVMRSRFGLQARCRAVTSSTATATVSRSATAASCKTVCVALPAHRNQLSGASLSGDSTSSTANANNKSAPVVAVSFPQPSNLIIAPEVRNTEGVVGDGTTLLFAPHPKQKPKRVIQIVEAPSTGASTVQSGVLHVASATGQIVPLVGVRPVKLSLNYGLGKDQPPRKKVCIVAPNTTGVNNSARIVASTSSTVTQPTSLSVSAPSAQNIGQINPNMHKEINNRSGACQAGPKGATLKGLLCSEKKVGVLSSQAIASNSVTINPPIIVQSASKINPPPVTPSSNSSVTPASKSTPPITVLYPPGSNNRPTADKPTPDTVVPGTEAESSTVITAVPVDRKRNDQAKPEDYTVKSLKVLAQAAEPSLPPKSAKLLKPAQISQTLQSVKPTQTSQPAQPSLTSSSAQTSQTLQFSQPSAVNPSKHSNGVPETAKPLVIDAKRVASSRTGNACVGEQGTRQHFPLVRKDTVLVLKSVHKPGPGLKLVGCKDGFRYYAAQKGSEIKIIKSAGNPSGSGVNSKPPVSTVVSRHTPISSVRVTTTTSSTLRTTNSCSQTENLSDSSEASDSDSDGPIWPPHVNTSSTNSALQASSSRKVVESSLNLNSQANDGIDSLPSKGEEDSGAGVEKVQQSSLIVKKCEKQYGRSPQRPKPVKPAFKWVPALTKRIHRISLMTTGNAESPFTRSVEPSTVRGIRHSFATKSASVKHFTYDPTANALHETGFSCPNWRYMQRAGFDDSDHVNTVWNQSSNKLTSLEEISPTLLQGYYIHVKEISDNLHYVSAKSGRVKSEPIISTNSAVTPEQSTPVYAFRVRNTEPLPLQKVDGVKLV